LAPPDIPKAGLDRRAYRARKFGSWEQSQALDAQVTAAAQPDGLVFRHELMERTPNTINAHRLIWLAGREGKQNAAVEALFAAYFHDGRDVGDTDVLIDIGTSVGLNGAQVSDMLASDEGLADVRGELDRARKPPGFRRCWSMATRSSPARSDPSSWKRICGGRQNMPKADEQLQIAVAGGSIGGGLAVLAERSFSQHVLLGQLSSASAYGTKRTNSIGRFYFRN